MYQFKDLNGYTVRMDFKQNAFSNSPKHVLVICQYGDQWLLTKHKKRGLEFPGGKVELGESLEAAAKREVYEETGASIKKLSYIGEYEVKEQDDSFVKAIFFAEIQEIQTRKHYFETEGPVVVGNDILTHRYGDAYSFIMKDSVIEKSLGYIDQMKRGKGSI